MHMENVTRADVEKMLAWAKEKIAAGQEPPWAWYQYMKLRETLEAILGGMSVTTTESSPQSEQHPGKHLRLVEAKHPQDTAPHRPSGLPTRLPM